MYHIYKIISQIVKYINNFMKQNPDFPIFSKSEYLREKARKNEHLRVFQNCAQNLLENCRKNANYT